MNPGGLDSKRIPSLDGLRAASIGLVLLSHLAGTKCFPVQERHIAFLGDLGNLGVRVFFVISGFLITTLLIQECERTGSISLPAFYVRRTFRIFPAFYLYLAAVAVGCCYFSWLQLRENDLFSAMTYTVNYHYDRAWWIGHIWSLSVEEQFYVLWPLAMRSLGKVKAIVAAAAVVVVAPIIRTTAFFYFPSFRIGIGESFPTIADAIAIGCVLAGYRTELRKQSWYLRVLQHRAFLSLAPVLIIIVNALHNRPRFSYPLGETIVNVAIALVVDRLVHAPNCATGRVLNSSVPTYIGALSYSIYLWQQPFLNRHAQAWFTTFPYNLLLVCAFATLSYHLVEVPFLNLRKSVERVIFRSKFET